MKKYVIKCDVEKEIEAKNEEEAMKLFYEELGNENDRLENHITVEGVKKQEFYKLDEDKKANLKNAIEFAGGCCIQYNEWTCGTCFMAISDQLNNKDWQTVLAVRGDYKLEDLDNLPKDIEKRVDRIIRICKNNPLYRIIRICKNNPL